MAKNLTIEEAMQLAMEGWQIRRAIWADAGITGQVLPPGALELRWIRYHRDATWHDNAYWIQSATISDRIVLATDVTITDVDAVDWTTDPPELPTGVAQTSWTDPNAGRAPGSAGSGGTGVPGSSGSSPGGTGIGGGGGSGGGSGSPARPARPSRTAPALTVTVSRVTPGTCVARDGDDQITPGPVTDDFTAHIALAADPAGASGALWHYSARWGCGPAGPGAIFLHGTLAPGASQDGAFSITSPIKEAVVVVSATAYLPLSALVTAGRGTSAMRGDCAPGVIGGYFAIALPYGLGAAMYSGAGGSGESYTFTRADDSSSAGGSDWSASAGVLATLLGGTDGAVVPDGDGYIFRANFGAVPTTDVDWSFDPTPSSGTLTGWYAI